MDTIGKAKKFLYEKTNDKYHILHAYETFGIIQFLFPADEDLQVSALLHDVLEDTNTTYDELAFEFGHVVADLVNEVTKTHYNTFPNLITQKGIILKYADRLSNLSHMENWTLKQKKKYIAKSRFWRTR